MGKERTIVFSEGAYWPKCDAPARVRTIELRCGPVPQATPIPGRRPAVPLLSVKLIEGVFTTAQKQEMIRKLTDTMVSIEGENMRPVTWVVIEEVKSGEWGVGGNPLTV